MPLVNPDGTVQAAAPTQSAFGQPPMAVPAGRQAVPPVQVHSGTPGFSGAILDAIRALAQAFAPKSLTQAKARTNQAIEEQSGAPQTTDLGNQF